MSVREESHSSGFKDLGHPFPKGAPGAAEWQEPPGLSASQST
jgi:hypothetical protein